MIREAAVEVEPRRLTRRHLRAVLGILWLVDALLQAEPSKFAGSYPLTDLAQSVMGAPQWENHLVYWLIRPFAEHWPWWNLGAVLVQAAIGVALVAGVTPRIALGASVTWSAVVWLVGEGMGMLPTGFALLAFGAPGAAALYGVISVLAWPSGPERGVGRRPWAVCWATLWAGAALAHLAWVYPTGQVLRASFEEAAIGEPPWLAGLSHGAARVALARPVISAVVLALVEAALSLGPIVDRARERAWLAGAVAVAVLFWVVGQLFGGLLTEGATDVGTGPLVALLALAAWPARPAPCRGGP